MAVQIIEAFATKCPCWTTNLAQRGIAPDAPEADPRYQQYYRLFDAGKIKLMLHSLGCARASADYQAQRWNVESNGSAIAHAVVDSNDGATRQTLRWDMRGWHCGNPGNNTHIGVEMCESDQIVYRTDKPWLFTVKDKAKAQAHCRTAYKGAVALFAYLCIKFGCDPLKDICSHKEGHAAGIASNHGDPEHYWTGLGMPYTMDTFRADVKAKIDEDSAPAPKPFPTQFVDVPAGAWYVKALLWCSANGIVSGVDSTHFDPNGKITRAQAAQMLYKEGKRANKQIAALEKRIAKLEAALKGGA